MVTMRGIKYSSLHVLQVVFDTSMMEAASTFETSVNVYQTTRRYNPEDSHFYDVVLLGCDDL
jgi:hypothetical protein